MRSREACTSFNSYHSDHGFGSDTGLPLPEALHRLRERGSDEFRNNEEGGVSGTC